MRWLIVQRSTGRLAGGDERRRRPIAPPRHERRSPAPSARPTRPGASRTGLGSSPARGHGVVRERADQQRDRPGQEPERAAVDHRQVPGPVEVEPLREPEVQRRRGDQERDPGRSCRRRSPAGPRATPARCAPGSGRALAGRPARRSPPRPRRRQLVPRLHPAVEVVEHEPEEDQPEVARRSPRRIAGQAPDGLEAPQERQPVREADREEELRHDRVGVAAIRVVVLQDRRTAWKPPRKFTSSIPRRCSRGTGRARRSGRESGRVGDRRSSRNCSGWSSL